MDSNTDEKNLLWELAQTMTSRDSYSAAVALRKLAQAGYATLDEVDAISDWVLLATPGIGVGRLGIVRRLIRPDWQPASRKTIETAERFLTAARFALRFWPVEALASIVEGSMPVLVTDRPVEKRLAVEMFSEAARKALRHDEAEAWVLALRQLTRGRDRQVHGKLEPHRAFSSQATAPAEGQKQPPTSNPMDTPPKPGAADPESDHYAFCSEERRRIVEHYRTAQKNGEVENKEAWAYNNHRISRKTLWRYEQEFPETESE